jgi:hypothetical protein
MESSSPSLQQAEEIKPESFSPLFTKVQKIYVQQFREWFAITAPTSVVAAVVLMLADWKVREIILSHHDFAKLYNTETIVETTLLRFGSYFFAWFLGCFALAAIATVVNRLDAEDEDAPLRDKHQRAREHMGAILKTAFAMFLALLIGLAIAEFVLLTIAKVVGYAHFRSYIYPATMLGMFIVAGIVARLGMAIPLLMRGDIGVWAALNESLKIGERHKGFLFLLVIQSVIGSYVGWYAVHYVLLLVPLSVKLAAWYGWAVVSLSALASAAVSPPMFIGFSLLAEEGQKESTDQSVFTLPG